MSKTLVLCLIGTIASSDRAKSIAVFSTEKSEYEFDFYEERASTFKRIGESLLEKKICDITSRFICLENEFGHLEQLINGHCISDADEITPVKEIERIDKQTWVSRAYYEHLSTGLGLAKTLMQAGSLPAFDSFGSQIGFSIWEIEKDSVYADVGLLDGDIITSINDMRLSDAATAIKILLHVRSEESWKLDILRNFEPLVIRISIK